MICRWLIREGLENPTYPPPPFQILVPTLQHTYVHFKHQLNSKIKWPCFCFHFYLWREKESTYKKRKRNASQNETLWKANVYGNVWWLFFSTLMQRTDQDSLPPTLKKTMTSTQTPPPPLKGWLRIGILFFPSFSFSLFYLLSLPLDASKPSNKYLLKSCFPRKLTENFC